MIVENLFPFRMRQLADIDDGSIVSQEGMISGTNSRFGVIPDMCSRREHKVAPMVERRLELGHELYPCVHVVGHQQVGAEGIVYPEQALVFVGIPMLPQFNWAFALEYLNLVLVHGHCCENCCQGRFSGRWRTEKKHKFVLCEDIDGDLCGAVGTYTLRVLRWSPSSASV